MNVEFDVKWINQNVPVKATKGIIYIAETPIKHGNDTYLEVTEIFTESIPNGARQETISREYKIAVVESWIVFKGFSRTLNTANYNTHLLEYGYQLN